jgi:hypothetical protein
MKMEGKGKSRGLCCFKGTGTSTVHMFKKGIGYAVEDGSGLKLVRGMLYVLNFDIT